MRTLPVYFLEVQYFNIQWHGILILNEPEYFQLTHVLYWLLAIVS